MFFDFINDESMEILNRFCFKIAKKFCESGFIKGEIKYRDTIDCPMQRFKLNLSTEQLEDMNFHCTVVTLRGKAGKWFNLIEYWDRIMRFSKEVEGWIWRRTERYTCMKSCRTRWAIMWVCAKSEENWGKGQLESKRIIKVEEGT